MLVLNIFLALVWAAVTSQMSVTNLVVGYFVGYAVLWIVRRPSGDTKYFAKVGQIARFCIFFVWELVVATLRVAIDIVTPRHLMKPAVLAIPVLSDSAAETTMLANVITLTPGTLTLDVSPDGKTLYVHAMYAGDADSTRQAIQEGFGHRVHEVFQ